MVWRLRNRLHREPVAILLTIALVLLAIAVPTAHAEETTSGPVFTVMNTSETPPDGVWFRRSPHTADTDRVTGHGVYVNERVQLRCYAWGDSVGPYNDTLWYKTLNVGRPTINGAENSGFLNAHYINDGKKANEVDVGVPDCSAAPAPPPTPAPAPAPSQPPTPAPTPTPPSPAPTPKVTLGQGPSAPAGYWYAITFSNFSPNSAVSATCYDSVSKVNAFTLKLDAAGNGSTQAWCYSTDGPDHWVVANGVESNHVGWGAASASTPKAPTSIAGESASPVNLPPATPAVTAARTRSVFFSGVDLPTGVEDISPADQNISLSVWSDNCTSTKAVQSIDLTKGSISTLAGWSKGRLGPIYVLNSAGNAMTSGIHRIVLFDPGSSIDFVKVTGWSLLLHPQTCDWQFQINDLLGSWLRSNNQNYLLVLTGAASEEKNGGDKPTYAGLWKYYLAGIWNQPFANRAQVCDYDNMGHEDILRTFFNAVRSSATGCPDGPHLTAWHP